MRIFDSSRFDFERHRVCSRHDIWTVCLTIVMPALVAGIHVFTARQQKRRGWQRKSGLPGFRIITVPQVG